MNSKRRKKAARVTKQESVVFKVTNAILISAVVAAFVTDVPGWNAGLIASPMPERVQSALKPAHSRPGPTSIASARLTAIRAFG